MTPSYSIRQTQCFECEGNGQIVTAVRWAGEAYGETVSTRCPDCNGTGQEDAGCSECRVVRPLNEDGVCEGCASFAEVEHLGPDCSVMHVKALVIGLGALVALIGLGYAAVRLVPEPVLFGVWLLATSYCAGRFILSLRSA